MLISASIEDFIQRGYPDFAELNAHCMTKSIRETRKYLKETYGIRAEIGTEKGE